MAKSRTVCETIIVGDQPLAAEEAMMTFLVVEELQEQLTEAELHPSQMMRAEL
jgi:hypothetical protein